MPLTQSASKKALSKNIAEEINAGKPQDQAAAIAYHIQRQNMADGGVPFFARAEAHELEHSGMIPGMTGGRADVVPTRVKNGSYVIPADVVSALGEGNSMSGAAILNRMFKMGPYGSGMPSVGASHMPMAKAPPMAKFASGGGVDIQASDGEYVVPPEKIAELGNGDLKRGHDILDAWVKGKRKDNIKTLRKMKPPKKR